MSSGTAINVDGTPHAQSQSYSFGKVDPGKVGIVGKVGIDSAN